MTVTVWGQCVNLKPRQVSQHRLVLISTTLQRCQLCCELASRPAVKGAGTGGSPYSWWVCYAPGKCPTLLSLLKTEKTHSDFVNDLQRLRWEANQVLRCFLDFQSGTLGRAANSPKPPLPGLPHTGQPHICGGCPGFPLVILAWPWDLGVQC